MATVKLNPDTGKVTGTHTDMPLVIIPSVITNLGTLTLAEAQSCRIYSDVGLTTELAREVVSADEIHVKIPSASSSTEIWFDYDGIASDYAVTDTYGRNAVWSAYELSWLVREGSGTTVVDSTGNGNNGTLVASPTWVTGKFGGALSFSGAVTNQYLTSSKTAADLNVDGNKDKTFAAWVKVTSTARWGAVFAIGSNTTNQQFVLYKQGSTTDSWYMARFGSNDTAFTTPPVVDVWKRAVIVHESSVMKIYMDGSFVTSKSASANLTNGTGFQLGNWTGNQLIGELSNALVKAGSTSADFIATEYNNQNDNASFWVATPAGGGGGNDPAGYLVWL